MLGMMLVTPLTSGNVHFLKAPSVLLLAHTACGAGRAGRVAGLHGFPHQTSSFVHTVATKTAQNPSNIPKTKQELSHSRVLNLTPRSDSPRSDQV